MSTDRHPLRGFVSLALLALVVPLAVGCVGPMAYPPGSLCCDSSGVGPFALGCGGSKCGDCSGCGELYIDPWINHPADICDPCDKCGNHNGQSCGKCRSVFSGIPSLWGYRRCDDGCDCGVGTCSGSCGLFSFLRRPSGCDACGEASCGCDGVTHGSPSYGSSHEFLPADDYVVGQAVSRRPTSSRGGGSIVEIHPAPKPYQPHRTRQIFQQRPDVAKQFGSTPPNARAN